MNRRVFYVLLAPVAAGLIGGGLKADVVTPQTALFIFVGALLVGWMLHRVIFGWINGLFNFWTPLIVLALIFGGPAAFSFFGAS